MLNEISVDIPYWLLRDWVGENRDGGQGLFCAEVQWPTPLSFVLDNALVTLNKDPLIKTRIIGIAPTQ